MYIDTSVLLFEYIHTPELRKKKKIFVKVKASEK